MENISKNDKYFSYNEYVKFCDKNNIRFDEKERKEINDKFINRKLEEYKEYFDNMFENVKLSLKLDEEQRKIILTDDDYCLINAGAGTGKSTTMAAKVKYLVDKLNIKPEEIVMLSFTKKSSTDLDEKVNDILDLGVPVSTFHSLGMKFVKKLYPYPVGVVGDDEKRIIIFSYVKELFKDKNKLKQLINLFQSYKKKSYIAKGFINNYDKFENFEDYFEDYKQRRYLIEKSKSGGIHGYLVNRLNSSSLLYTIKGEKVKSIPEVRIANLLYANGIDYTYEKIYDEKVNEDTTYHPDFTINYNGKTIYIEYFGLSSCYNENNDLIMREVRRYNRERKTKEKFQESSKDDFINLDYINRDGYYLDTLKNELSKRNVVFERRSDEEIFFRILDNNLYAELFEFISLISSFIEIFKNMLVNDEDYMFNKVISKIKEGNFKYSYYYNDKNREIESRVKAVEFLREIFNYYQEYLTKNHMIDYNDMINLSYKEIIKNVKNKYPELNYKYIIVDEYQDITFQRYLFVKRLTEYFNAKLISVGDDWQSIYSFTGSRLELFNKFSEMFLNSKDDMYLSTTYRYGQELADISSKFILENSEQSTKHLKAIKSLKNPIEICKCKYMEEYDEIYRIVKDIYIKNKNSEILILARTNECLRKLSNSKYFTKGPNDILICKDIPNAKIEALTMHRSKGLTADEVIVFGLREKIFPSKGKDSHWIFEYFKLDSIKEQMPFAEERRLFYVSLTRTRNKVYLIVPINRISQSKFVGEIVSLYEKERKE